MCGSWMFHVNPAQVSRINWWMGAFGAATAKPQYAYSNSPSIRKLHHYAPSTWKVKKNDKVKVETCRKYQNKEGKDCYTGTSALKGTETLECNNNHWLGMSTSVHFSSFKSSWSPLPLPHSFSRQPRIYPDRFGMSIADMIDDLKGSAYGCPKLPSHVPRAIDSYQASKSGKGTSLFDHADLESAYKYIRGGRGLTIPKDWEGLVPTSI